MQTMDGYLVRKALLVLKHAGLSINHAIHYRNVLLIRKTFSDLFLPHLNFFQLVRILRHLNHRRVLRIRGIPVLASFLTYSVVTVTHHWNLGVDFVAAASVGAQPNCLMYAQRHSLQQQQSTKSWSQVLRPRYCKLLK